MKRICLINVYFSDSLPDYFPYFIKSMQLNPLVDFLFISNIAIDISNSSNINQIQFSLEEFNSLASSKLGFSINVKTGYKLCDFKPAYGKIFEDYLSTYDFWGYTDIDVILGDIISFITNEVLNKFEVISTSALYLSGWFALYKNNRKVNNFFLKSSDIAKILTSDENYAFDECGNETLQMVFDFYRINAKYCQIYAHSNQCMTHLLKDKKNEINVFWQSMSHEFSNIIPGEQSDILIRDNRGLFSVNSNKEYILGHLISIKKNKFPLLIASLKQDCESITCSHLTLANTIEEQKKAIFSRLNFMRKKFKLRDNWKVGQGFLKDNKNGNSIRLKEEALNFMKEFLLPNTLVDIIDRFMLNIPPNVNIEGMNHEGGLYLSPYWNRVFITVLLLYNQNILVELID